MDKKSLAKIVAKVDKKNRYFKRKSFLNTLDYPDEIIGREKQTEELVSYLCGYKQNFVVPLVSIYGRSGSGKSTIARFVCENLEDISYCFVNLRKAKTVFGSLNLILGELGEPNLKNAQGVSSAIKKIEDATVSKLVKENKNFLVLVLDEFDALFYDKRGSPSDFVYKLLVLEENLQIKGLHMCIVCISNNVLNNYELDDRVKSRIGSSEIFFSPYSKDDVVKILRNRAMNSLKEMVDQSVIEYCAESSTIGHGDARRAVDLFRVSLEIASEKGEKLGNSHIDIAAKKLDEDRLVNILSSSSYHFRVVCFSLARLTFLTDEDWQPTSTIVKQYKRIIGVGKPLSYRRIAELLVELENTGLVVSQTSSKGRYGYRTKFMLSAPPEFVMGTITDEEYWKRLIKTKQKHDEYKESSPYKHPGNYGCDEADKIEHNKKWKEYVGL